jgi:hypothetical protein
MSQVSFAADIKPLFRTVEISHMHSFDVKLDDYTYMSTPDNANSVLATLSPRKGEPPSMSPGGPYWTAAQLELFVQWPKGDTSLKRKHRRMDPFQKRPQAW